MRFLYQLMDHDTKMGVAVRAGNYRHAVLCRLNGRKRITPRQKLKAKQMLKDWARTTRLFGHRFLMEKNARLQQYKAKAMKGES